MNEQQPMRPSDEEVLEAYWKESLPELEQSWRTHSKNAGQDGCQLASSWGRAIQGIKRHFFSSSDILKQAHQWYAHNQKRFIPRQYQECLTDPHHHILARLHENTTTNAVNPSYATNVGNRGGASTEITSNPNAPKKEGDEFAPTGEEKREVSLGKKILAAAGKLAKTPDVEAILRCADELVKMHGKE